MPRLTQRDHCSNRTLLGILLRNQDPALGRLPVTEQRDLLDYFAPTLNFSAAELRAYRSSVTKRDPSLPQRAGRAWAKLQRCMSVGPVRLHRGRGKRNVHVVVHGQLRPEPDYDKFVRALLLIDNGKEEHIVKSLNGDLPHGGRNTTARS